MTHDRTNDRTRTQARCSHKLRGPLTLDGYHRYVCLECCKLLRNVSGVVVATQPVQRLRMGRGARPERDDRWALADHTGTGNGDAMTPTAREWQRIELNPPDSKDWNFTIPYQWRTEQYGRAEFSVCIRWKRRKITDLWISPHQQPGETGKLYHVNVHGSTGVSLSHGSNVWMVSWCKEHKAQNFCVYVPNDTDTLYISLLSSVTFMFSKDRVRS